MTPLQAQEKSCADAGSFDDRDLKTLLRQSKKHRTLGVIYSWSPHMVLSFEGIKELKEIAAHRKIETTILLEPFADARDVEVVATHPDHGITPSDCRRINSRKLWAAGIGIHYPTYIFYRHGKILMPRFPGYEAPEKLDQFIINKFNLRSIN